MLLKQPSDEGAIDSLTNALLLLVKVLSLWPQTSALISPKVIGGVRFVNFCNFFTAVLSTPLFSHIDETDSVSTLSELELTAIYVKLSQRSE